MPEAPGWLGGAEMGLSSPGSVAESRRVRIRQTRTG
jgi:hypothetical protein